MSIKKDIRDYLVFEDETSLRYPFAKTMAEMTEKELKQIEDLCGGDGSTEAIYRAALKVLGPNEKLPTKGELRKAISGGMALKDILSFGPGQDCEIFKAKEFSDGEKVIYVPDVALNEIPIDRPVTDPDELESVLSCCYTGNDFIEVCDGSLELAERLFWYCDWQHPSSAYSEVCEDEEE